MIFIMSGLDFDFLVNTYLHTLEYKLPPSEITKLLFLFLLYQGSTNNWQMHEHVCAWVKGTICFSLRLYASL